jgi:hypothetical protein
MSTLTLGSLRTFRLLHHPAHSLLEQKLICSRQFQVLQRRLASSSTTTTTAVAPSTSLSKVNGPSTTLPAPLTLPTRLPTQPFLLYAFAVGKAYLAFYKTGVKNIYTNFRASLPLQRMLDNKFSGSLSEAISGKALTRSDFQLLHRNWHDIKRLPVFALVVLCCGEFTPLVVITISSIVPWTCRIPTQIESDLKKLEERRAISFGNLTAEPPKEKGAGALERMHLLHISWSLGLRSTAWDWLGYAGLADWMLRSKVGRRVLYLEMDDALIQECGGVGEMEGQEVRMACIERGVDVLGKSEEQLRMYLEAWLKAATKVPVERLLLTR